jgi:hypothetical protein
MKKKPQTTSLVEFPAVRFSELALQHSVTSGKAFEQLCTAAAAKTPTAQVLELKRLLPLLEPTDSASELRLLTACLAELLLVPHPFAFHTQLKLSLGALCSASAEAERVLLDTLSARLAALLAARSLCPGGRVLPGVLREGSMPGWLPLLLDTPPGLVLLRTPPGPLLRLVTRSLHDACCALRRAPGSAAAEAPCAAVQELCKLQQLLLRHFDRDLRRSELVIPPLGRCTAADTPGDLDGDLDGQLDEQLAACGDGEAFGLLCDMCLQLLRLPLLPADAAVSAAHLLGCCLGLLPSRREAAAAMASLLRTTWPRAVSDAARVAVLRGLANGSATATLLAPLPAAPEAAAAAAAAAAVVAEVQPEAPRCTMADGGGEAHSSGEVGSRCLLFGPLGSSILEMCASCVVPAHKLGAFRALESLLTHVEAVATPDHARRSARAAAGITDGAGAAAGAAGLILTVTAGAAGAAGLSLTVTAGAVGATAGAAGATAGATAGAAGETAGAARAAEASGHLDVFLRRTLQLLWDHWEVPFASLVVMFAPLQRRVLAMA